MLTLDENIRVRQILLNTFAYAAGVSVSTLAPDTKLTELGIDSVTMFSAGAVLQAELDIGIADPDVIRIFMADTILEAISITCSLYETSAVRFSQSL